MKGTLICWKIKFWRTWFEIKATCFAVKEGLKYMIDDDNRMWFSYLVETNRDAYNARAEELFGKYYNQYCLKHLKDLLF